MTRTPDEIKKGLECCKLHDGDMYTDCSHCPYYLTSAQCDLEMHDDAIALIQQLQHNNAQLAIDKAMMAAENAEKDARIQQLEKDNDRLTDEVCNAYNIQNEQLARIKQLEGIVSEKEKVVVELSGEIGQLEAERNQLLEKIEMLEATSEE